MKLVNNRYKIINRLKQNKMFSSYLVSDMWNESKKMQLNILNFDSIPSSLIDFFSEEFIGLINLDSKNILKDYYFNRVSYINNKKNTEEQYFYTCEYIKNPISLLEFIDDMTFTEVMDVFIEICKAVNYLHLNGYTYGHLNLNNIFIEKNNGDYTLKLKDIATVELEKNCFIYDKDNSYFKYPKNSIDKPNRESDIYSLGVLLLIMLKKQYCNLKPKDELDNFKKELENNSTTFNSDEINHINKLLSIIDKAITIDEPYPYEYIYDMVKDINDSLNKDYKIVDKKELEQLNFHTKLIGRENEIDNIIKAYDSMIKYKPANKIFLIQGYTGTGKTRFLEEIKFLLELKNANIYSSFSLSNSNESNNKLWAEILRKLVFETDSQTTRKYESELMKFFPDIIDRKSDIPIEYLNENTSRYRLLNRISGFINDSIKNKTAVFIIDNIHFANSFTIDTFTYLYKEVINNKNIILIFSYNDGEALGNSRFSEFISDIKKRKDSLIMHMNNLDRQQSGEMIKNLMSMFYVPMGLAEKIYSQSYGNPLFITEVIKELYNSKMIYINDEVGWWYIDIPKTDDDDYYNDLHLPNTIEQAILNQLKNLDSISHEILKVISIFTNPISTKVLAKFIDMDIEKIEIQVQSLVNKGILTIKIEDRGYVYDINNRVSKDIIYEKISSEEKARKHKIAAEILESEDKINNNYDELILHLEKANMKDKAKEYCIANAKKMRSLRDIRAEIKNLEKALSLVEDENTVESTNLLIKIGELYFETGDIQPATDIFSRAENLAKTTNNNRNLIDIYINMAQIMNMQSNSTKTIEYLDKAEKLLAHYEYFEGQLEIKRIKAMLLVDKNLLDESIHLCKEIIEECGENFNKVKGNTYRLLAYIYIYTNKVEESITLYEESIKLLETVDYSRGILVALNNIGSIYNDYYQDTEKALSYFSKVKELSEEYGILSSEILGLINVAVVYHAKYDYMNAYDYFKLALEKAIKINLKNEVFFLYNILTMLCIDMNNYQEAFYYYKLAEKELEDSPNQGMDIVEFYDTSGYLYNTYGDFDKANKFLIETINFYKDGDIITKFNNIIDLNINKLRSKEVSSYDGNIEEIISTSNKIKTHENKIYTLTHASIVLSKRYDYKNAKTLMSEAEKYMSEQIHDEIQARYYYSKAMIKTGKDTLKLLLISLEYAKKVMNEKLIAHINIELGNVYFSEKNYYYAANYYIEACEILRKLIVQIPDEYKLTYVNSYGLAKPFFRIKYIKTILINKIETLIEFKSDFSVNSLEELQDLISKDETNTFMENKDFMDFITKQYMESTLGNVITERDIMTNISTNTTYDIQLITRYLASQTLATRGLVIIEGQKQDLNVISSIDDNCNLPENTRLFDRIRVTLEPLMLSDKLYIDENDISFLGKGIRACLCMPIMNNKELIGYLYLESNRILNNFNDGGLKKCIDFSNLLSLLIEKYKLKLSASIDKLTGALTRKYLEDSLNNTLDRAISKRKTFSLIMYDIDDFKKVNDRFGHQTGDEVLRKISEIVLDNIDKEASLGRYGGEEFIIILPDVENEEALSIANELREKIAAENILGDKLDVTISMGVVSYPKYGQTINELIEKVDKALYAAKENGKNRCELWNSDFTNMTKVTNTLDSILTGNEIQDSRNVLTLIELIEATNSDIDKKEAIYIFLGRIIEITEAQFGIFLLVKENKVINYFGKTAHTEGWVYDLNFNSTIVDSVVKNKQGLYMIDWDDIEKYDLITGLPDWHSILAVPIIVKDQIKGVIYLSSSTKIKEFGVNDLNFVNVLCNLMATIL